MSILNADINFMNFFKFLMSFIFRSSKKEDHKQLTSISSLEQMGVMIKPVNRTSLKDEIVLYSSQLPLHIVPWINFLKQGTYQIAFSPEVQSQIKSGVFTLTGGVARNESGQIVAHGKNISQLVSLSPIILYQIGTIVFGAYHLSKINESLKSMNKKLNEIFDFLQDERSARIEGGFQEFSHLSKGIIEFYKSGNISEVLRRIDIVRYIRTKNLPHILHLKKDLSDSLDELQYLERTSWFSSEKETEDLLESIEFYENHLINYAHSLLLDIICTKTEVAFSTYPSIKETKSRLLSRTEDFKFLKQSQNNFEKVLKKQIPKLIEDDNIKKRKVRERWKKAQEIIDHFNKIIENHHQSFKDIMQTRGHNIFLKNDLAVKNKQPGISEKSVA